MLFKHFSYKDQPWVAFFFNETTYIFPREEEGLRNSTYYVGPHSFKVTPTGDAGISAEVETVLQDNSRFKHSFTSTPDLSPEQQERVDQLLAKKEQFEDE